MGLCIMAPIHYRYASFVRAVLEIATQYAVEMKGAFLLEL